MDIGSGEGGAVGPYVLGLGEVDARRAAVVGGKAVNLGALSRIEGTHVPPGFCVTTAAFEALLVETPSLDGALERLAGLPLGDQAAIRAQSAEVRRVIEGAVIPGEVAAAITGALARLGHQTPCAVRSSATAEDSATASFAGQHDTWLNVVGPAAVLRHVGRCWASLFTHRAVAYRVARGLDPRRARMAVVVQQMVPAQASGVLFTADPVSGNRRVAAVEAGPGLGEALVSGRVNGDGYRVREGSVVSREVRLAKPALTDAQVLALVHLGRRIEAHLGRPQDIEWCLADGVFHVVQSRPITGLFPIPEASDQVNRVYLSVGHQQMMTDAMKPLGLSLFQLTSRAPMREAGGRLFVEVTDTLASPARREGLLAMVGKGDPLTRDALKTLLAREDFLRPAIGEAPGSAASGAGGGPPAAAPPAPDPALVAELIDQNEASLATLAQEIGRVSGAALVDFILADLDELRRVVFDPRSYRVILAGMEAAWWLNDHLEDWLGEKGAADTLTRSVPHDVTAEMGLALLDVADVIRPHPQVVARLEEATDEGFLDGLDGVPGGAEARDALQGYLDRYGMRCVGEIDITRPRWRERPTALLPLLLANVEGFEAGEAARRFEAGREAADRKALEVLERLRGLPDGAQKAEETEAMIARLRTLAGYREYPKYAIVRRYFHYKEALLREAARLVAAGVLEAPDDVFFLTLPELAEVARTCQVDPALLRARREAHAVHQALTPPRVLTSEGEGLTGSYHREDPPAGALPGLAVSAGTIEGRARVALDLASADLEAGDILVTAYTDPSWTPVLVAAAGLVAEVGGLMTHGAVIAREYGVPAVVGVAQATRRIRDGQRIRVHGTEGYVELLGEPEGIGGG